MSWSKAATRLLETTWRETIQARSMLANMLLDGADHYHAAAIASDDLGDSEMAAAYAIDCVRCAAEALYHDRLTKWRRLLD